MRVTIASRRSDLARIQAYQVGEALRTAHPQLELNYSFHESLGDKNLNDPLWKMPEKGVFTQDFREGLLRGDFDLVVHSWKDLAIDDDPETEIVATLPRADARDVLLVRDDRWTAAAAAGCVSVFTSSPRRAYNLDPFLRAALPGAIREMNFLNVRGNVPTRVRKLLESDIDGLIVAKAALDRLLSAEQPEFSETRVELRRQLSYCRWMVLPLAANPSAPAQGALAVEISRQRPDLRELLAPINCGETFAVVARERAILAGYGGGCHQKIGVSVLRRDFGEVTCLRGLTDDGAALNSRSFASSQPVINQPVSREELWPLDARQARLFNAEPIEAIQPDQTAALWIAKADALPPDWQLGRRQIVWTSGLQTWKRLAQRGVWVNGSAEGLGEQEPTRIETLFGSEIQWLKLTHSKGFAGDLPMLSTYRLAPRDGRIDLSGRKYFFWKSGSAFELALADNAWLKAAKHYCGPGNTQRILRSHGIEPVVFLDHEHWLEEMCETD